MPTNLHSCLALFAGPTFDSIVSPHVVVDRLRVCVWLPFGPKSILNRNYVCCSRNSRAKAHGIRLHRASGLEVLRSSLHMECLLVRVLFAVSIKSKGLSSPRILTGVPKFPTIPLVLEEGASCGFEGTLQGRYLQEIPRVRQRQGKILPV